MTMREMKIHHAYLLLALFAASPALAQASASVAAGNLGGKAQTGLNQVSPAAPQDRLARGPRTDDNCDTGGVTVQSGNGSACASVSTSPGGPPVQSTAEGEAAIPQR